MTLNAALQEAALDDPLVYLSVAGEEGYTPLSAARIPVLDRGFIFGDGVYEVVPVYRRVPFRLAQHLARLARSLAAIGLANPYPADAWLERMKRLMAAQPANDQLLYLQITRGVAKRAHAFPQPPGAPTVFMMSTPLSAPSASVRAQGVAVVSAIDNRWLRCDIKSISLLGNVLMAEHAAQAGVAETILFRDEYLTEASSSNVWIVKHGVLMAPPANERLLEGIRYALLAELAEQVGLPMTVRPIARAEVQGADEILLSSATKEVLAVTRLDGVPVGLGAPGPIYARLFAAYQQAKAEAYERGQAEFGAPPAGVLAPP